MKNVKKAISFLVVILLILGLAYYFLFIFEKKESNYLEEDNSKIAKDVLSWLDNQKKESGLYFLERKCLNEKCTEIEDSISSLHQYPFILWARYKDYQKDNESN